MKENAIGKSALKRPSYSEEHSKIKCPNSDTGAHLRKKFFKFNVRSIFYNPGSICWEGVYVLGYLALVGKIRYIFHCIRPRSFDPVESEQD